MDIIPQVGQAIGNVLGDIDEQVARETGFTRRESKLSATKFVQAVVSIWLGNPDATLCELAQGGAAVGVPISPQGLDQRFGPEAAALLEWVLNRTLGEMICADPVTIPLLQRFHQVVIQDSSVISLPDELAQVWEGCGGSGEHGRSSVKLQVRYDVLRGTLQGPLLEAGRCSDRASALPHASEAGALHLADLGYFGVERLGRVAAEGGYFLTRFNLQTALFDEEGRRLDLLRILAQAPDEGLDLAVRIGAKQHLSVRLLAVRVRQEIADQRRRKALAHARDKGETPSRVRLKYADWTVLVTNVPTQRLSLAEAMVLVGVRWQIELLFKLWKAQGKVDEWRSKDPWRILCETYAKLTAMIIQHWLTLAGCWSKPNRSMVKAAQAVRKYALMLASAVAGRIDVQLCVEQICRTMQTGCTMNRRKQHPNTYQLLLHFQEDA
jgi:hypothetical protein